MNVHVRRGFADLLADRRGHLDAPHFPQQVAAIVAVMVRAFREGKKVLWCGNGGSAADAQHLAAEFSGRFLRERGGLPSEALNAPAAEGLYAELVSLTRPLNGAPASEVLARRITDLVAAADQPTRLRDCGVSETILHLLAVEASEQWTARFNPRPVTEDDLYAVYRAAW